MNKLLCIVLFFFLIPRSYHLQTNNEVDKDFTTEVDKYINLVQKRYGIPGISIAIIQNDQVVYRKNIGKANIEHNVPLTDRSIFRVYSLTKLSVSVAIFKLIEQEKISLNDPLSKYLSDLPLSWQTIQIKHLLTHSSGLPDMAPFIEFESLNEQQAREKVFSQPLRFDVGIRYEYNQTGFWLLKRIIEKITNTDLESYIIKNQFQLDRNRTNVFLSSDSRQIISNRVTPYFPFRTGTMLIDHSFGGNYIVAANGLNLTLDQFIKWDHNLTTNQLINEHSKKTMWSNFEYEDSNKQFAYGWDKHQVNKEVSFGFSGSLVTAYRHFPNKKLSIIFLSNGLEHYFNIESVMNHIAGLVDGELMDINSYIFESLLQTATEKSFKEFKQQYAELSENQKNQNVSLEAQVNSVGYMLLNIQRFDQALKIFDFNKGKFPESWNTYDSLGEAYELTGDMEKAIINYKKAIAKNTLNVNDNNTRLIRKIGELSKEN